MKETFSDEFISEHESTLDRREQGFPFDEIADRLDGTDHANEVAQLRRLALAQGVRETFSRLLGDLPRGYGDDGRIGKRLLAFCAIAFPDLISVSPSRLAKRIGSDPRTMKALGIQAREQLRAVLQKFAADSRP